jgi:ABC-type oligopeptide transport system substrate-binding subunit
MTRRASFELVAAAIGLALLVAAALTGPAHSANSRSGAGAKQGGTFRINLVTDTDYVDPALAYYAVSWSQEYATCAKLLNYPDQEAPAGSQLIPEVATGFPRVSADGKTYTFTIRSGSAAYRFSDGKTVTAANFAAAINRDLNPRMQSPAVSFLTDVAGAADVMRGKAKTASGVVVRGNQLTIKLTQASPDFPARIAMPFFCAIPVDLPIVSEGVDTLPGAGPYYVASRTPNRQIVLKANPYYRGPRPHNVAEVVYTVGVSQEASLLQIQQDQADYAADGLSPSAYAELGAKYGVNKTRFFVKPQLVSRFVAMNNDRPLFKGNTSLRRAVNYAIDRPAILRQLGSYSGKRTDQYLPPGVPGYTDAALYPMKGSDYATAKKLAAGHVNGDTAVLYTCNRTTCINAAQILQYNFKQLGINVDVKSFARGVQIAKEGTRGEPFDLAFEAWVADYADPFDFINVLLDGNTIHETNNVNYAYFNDPAYNKKMEAAAKLSGAARYAAYGKLDIDLANHAAPFAAFATANDRLFFSSRVSNVVHNSVYGLDLATLALK